MINRQTKLMAMLYLKADSLNTRLDMHDTGGVIRDEYKYLFTDLNQDSMSLDAQIQHILQYLHDQWNDLSDADLHDEWMVLMEGSFNICDAHYESLYAVTCDDEPNCEAQKARVFMNNLWLIKLGFIQ